jgi:uncharacterized protein
MLRTTYLVHQEHIPTKAAFPLIDAHNHLWGSWDNAAELVTIFDQVGVVAYCDLTANVSITWAGGGYRLGQGSFEGFLARCVERFPGRFYGFTTATFAQPTDCPLFTVAERFVDETIALLRHQVSLGARGLKILKELGLHYHDGEGKLIAVDDARLAPIWEEAGRLGIPVLIHQSDPVGFFEPITPENEHYDTLQKYPTWSFGDPRFPRKAELIARRDSLIRRHPHTTFMLPHVANYPEDLAYVGRLLDECPNVYIDFAARMDELGRQPYTAREFMLRYQDRIYFGTDMPASLEMYRCYFRFLETFDEYFFPPDYDGTFGRHRWPIYGLGLPREVLAKIYYRNAQRIVPGLKGMIEERG